MQSFSPGRMSARVFSGGGGVTCICCDTGMCHYFGYFFGAAPGFLGTFLGYSRIFGYHFFGYSRIFGYHFLVKFDFFRNNSDFGVLILIFPSMTLWNVCCLQGSCFYDSTVLTSVLLCLCKEFHVVYNSYQFEFVYLQCFLILTSFYHCG